MTPSLDPFAALVRPDGSLEPDRKTVETNLSGMRAFYQAVPDDAEDRLIYRVHHMPVPETGSEIACSTTIVEAGSVGAEYFMTRGHFHRVRDRSEVYLGISGEGLLLMATESGDHRVEPLRQGTAAYIPGGWAHRSVNTGSEPLVFFAAYVADAGHDYETVAACGFPVLVVRGAAGPEVVANPSYARSPR
jgi:glucose-6-phosphate isomerase, archaeal